MKFKVRLFVAGTVYFEKFVCRNYQEAREVALSRNPNAKVLSDTAFYN